MKTLTSQQVKSLERQNSSFGKAYFQICQLHNLTVLPHLISNNPCELDLDIQKISKDQEFTPVIISLKKNRDLQKISIHSESKNKNVDGTRLTRIIPELLASLRDVLVFNPHLTTLNITNIILKEAHLQILAKGLLNNGSLNYLSLSQSDMGDSGLFILAPALRTLKSLRVLDLSACSLTEKGAYIISMFLKSLAVRRQSDVWKHSLRLSPLDVDPRFAQQTKREAPKTLKRLSLCKNNLKDAGVSILFDLLVEEVGLVGLDLQFNQITEGCGKKSITLLKTNRDLCILDLRNNELGNLLIDLEKQTLNKLSQYLAINEKLRTVANPIPDPDLEWLDAKDPFKNDKVGKSRVLQQTRSSVGKLSSSSNPNISACSSKIDTGLVALKAMARNTSTSRPKSTITNTLKSKPNASQSKAPRKTFAPRIKPTVPKTNTSKLATEVKKIKSTNISNSDRLYQAKDIQKARHDPQEIEMVLRALDDYHKRTGVTGIHKLSEKSTIISPTGSNQISQSAKHNHISSDHSESALKDENYVLKKRVDALEKLFKSFMASLPVVGDIHSIAPPQTDIFAQRISTSTRSVHFDQNNDVTKQGHYNIAPNQSQKPIGESFNDFNDYSPSNHTVQHYFKVANLPPLASTFDFSNQQFNNLITNPVKTDIMEIKGALQKPPSSLEDMIKLLENSLEGFHKVLDKLEAGVAKG